MGSGNFFKAIIGSKKGKQTKVCFTFGVIINTDEVLFYNNVSTWPSFVTGTFYCCEIKSFQEEGYSCFITSCP